MKRLLLTLLLALSAAGSAFAQTAAVQEFTNYPKAGSRTIGYVQMFKARDERVNGAALVKGADWGGRLYADAAAFPSNSSLSWFVPAFAPPSGGVWGYLHLKTGQAEGAAPAVKSAVKPLAQINSLAFSVDAVADGRGEFNLMSDSFIYKGATLDAGGKWGELGLFMHIADSQRAWAMSQPPIGDGVLVTRDGRRWFGRVAGGVYLMYFPEKGDYMSGVFDLKEFLDNATGRGFAWASGGTFGGTAIGVEPVSGGGFATLKSYTPPTW